MRTLQIKSFSKDQNYQGHFFFILCKGMNSGKPLKSPCPNCFVCICQSEQEKELLYWISFGLWHAKAYHSYLRGSVIPFLTISDVQQQLSKSLIKAVANPQSLQESIQLFQKLDNLEALYEKNLQLIRDTRRAMFYRRSFL